MIEAAPSSASCTEDPSSSGNTCIGGFVDRCPADGVLSASQIRKRTYECSAGCSRSWPLLVPTLAATAADPGATAADRAAAVDRFHTLHTVLGQIVGEAFGYLLTAAWTVLIVVALRRGGAGRPVPHRFVLGRFSAGLALLSVPLILTGLLVPLGAPGADLANFIGYVAWSLWLVVFGVGLLRDSRRQARMVTDRGDRGHIA